AVPAAVPSFPTRRSSDLGGQLLCTVGELPGAVGELPRPGLRVARAVGQLRGAAGELPGPGRELLGTAAGRADPVGVAGDAAGSRSEEHTSELQSRFDLVC